MTSFLCLKKINVFNTVVACIPNWMQDIKPEIENANKYKSMQKHAISYYNTWKIIHDLEFILNYRSTYFAYDINCTHQKLIQMTISH